MDRLNYNQLFYFYVVATEGSVKAACQKLHVSQPTVSGQLRQFETDLGYDLFVRKHRKLEINAKGKSLLQKAEKIFRLGDEIVHSLRSKEKTSRETLRLGVLQTLPSNFLHDFTLKAWSDPKIRIKVLHGTHKQLLARLNDDEVDLILSDTPLSRSSRVYRSVHLGQQPLIVIGTKKFANLKKEFPYSLGGSACLSMGFSGQVQSELEYFFKINNIQPDFIGQIDDLELMQIAAENSHCVSILPEKVARRSLKNPDMVKIGEISEVSLHFWLITTQLGGKKVLIRKLVNHFIKRKKN